MQLDADRGTAGGLNRPDPVTVSHNYKLITLAKYGSECISRSRNFC